MRLKFWMLQRLFSGKFLNGISSGFWFGLFLFLKQQVITVFNEAA